jgi:hypothetical protein
MSFLGLAEDEATSLARFLDRVAERMARVSGEATNRGTGLAWHGPDHEVVNEDVQAFAFEMRQAAERMAARAALIRAVVARQEQASK